ncbi:MULTISPECIES: hypothetical protein [Acinetobacter]|uniref:hypothetical protein n=1 Tax=Acinetobacter TaxID=469 RepID=UPI000F66FA4E|nr:MULTISPECIES: hypothetical protein [Acinetobacter]MCU4406675.1 hypothetical protein [Acinetobacter junii]MDA3500756.1 hypothetical protein [Acinetobacter sp. AOR34_HL]QUS48764.1 hypothetical protein J5N61_09430 [Acinetobacter junii]RSE36962.1 hypothetical protein EGT64_05570 [Acinetobacter junii]
MSNINLHDQFAMAAMQGFIADGAKDRELIAEMSYKQADAMVTEREKGSVESVDLAKKSLVEAINRKHPGLDPNVNTSLNHLIFQLETGLLF